MIKIWTLVFLLIATTVFGDVVNQPALVFKDNGSSVSFGTFYTNSLTLGNQRFMTCYDGKNYGVITPIKLPLWLFKTKLPPLYLGIIPDNKRFKFYLIGFYHL